MATLLGAQLSTFDLETLSGSAVPSINGFRLTLTTAVPVTTSDVTGATTIYLTPYIGAQIALYDGSSAWAYKTSAEVSLAIGTLTSGKNYDVFAYLSGGNLTLEAVAWTNDTTRATAITMQDGVYVKSGTTTKRYVGTFRTTSTTTTEDSAAKRFLWNASNRVSRVMAVPHTTDNYTYSTATWRQANADSANQLAYVDGLCVSHVYAQGRILAGGSAGTQDAHVGIGLDSTSANSGGMAGGGATNNVNLPGYSMYRGYPGIGYHYLALLERGHGSGTQAWWGDAGAPTVHANGIFGSIDA